MAATNFWVWEETGVLNHPRRYIGLVAFLRKWQWLWQWRHLSRNDNEYDNGGLPLMLIWWPFWRRKRWFGCLPGREYDDLVAFTVRNNLSASLLFGAGQRGGDGGLVICKWWRATIISIHSSWLLPYDLITWPWQRISGFRSATWYWGWWWSHHSWRWQWWCPWFVCLIVPWCSLAFSFRPSH